MWLRASQDFVFVFGGLSEYGIDVEVNLIFVVCLHLIEIDNVCRSWIRDRSAAVKIIAVSCISGA